MILLGFERKIGIILVVFSVITLVGLLVFALPFTLQFGEAVSAFKDGNDPSLQQLGFDDASRVTYANMLGTIITLGIVWMLSILIVCLLGIYLGLQMMRGRVKMSK